MKRFEMYATDSSGLRPGSTVWSWANGNLQELVGGISPLEGQRIVYADGGFDLFSSGNIEFLRLVVETEQKQYPSLPPPYVVAGIHDDATINKKKGLNYPIMNAFERSLCVLQCNMLP